LGKENDKKGRHGEEVGRRRFPGIAKAERNEESSQFSGKECSVPAHAGPRKEPKMRINIFGPRLNHGKIVKRSRRIPSCGWTEKVQRP